MISQANLPPNERDPMIDNLISRFVRSVIRLFSLVVVISPTAAALVLTAITCSLNTASDVLSNHQFSTSVTSNGSTSGRSASSNYRGVTITGVLSLVRATLPIVITSGSGKESKKKNLSGFVLKSRRIFQVKFLYFY